MRQLSNKYLLPTPLAPPFVTSVPVTALRSTPRAVSRNGAESEEGINKVVGTVAPASADGVLSQFISKGLELAPKPCEALPKRNVVLLRKMFAGPPLMMRAPVPD